MRRLFYFGLLILYTHHITNRINYVANWLGNLLLGAPIKVVTDIAHLPAEGCIINYGPVPLPVNSYWLYPQGLLHQQDIRQQSISVIAGADFPYFFAAESGQYSFDILAASFYLISRYEEYDEYEKDEYGRYHHTNSIAFRHHFLQRPLVDEWLLDLRIKLQQHFPELVLKPIQHSYLPTYDVDMAWSYRNKGWIRNAGGAFNDFVKAKWKLLWNRILVLSNFEKDPFEIFDSLQALHEHYQLKPIYFFLLAGKNEGYDKNTPRNNKQLCTLMKWLSREATTGIHFSWAASSNFQLMEEEQSFLSANTNGNKPIDKNRMHYLNFHLPKTFRQLLQLSSPIQQEYSMGYGTINGFRASTSNPFFWYDLEQELETNLQLFPFAWMDANSIFEQKDLPDAAMKEWQAMYDLVKKTGGVFITICHNHLIGLNDSGRVWWKAYNHFLNTNFTRK